MNTIDDMQNGKSFCSQYNEFEYNHDYEKYWNTKTFIKVCILIIITRICVRVFFIAKSLNIITI